MRAGRRHRRDARSVRLHMTRRIVACLLFVAALWSGSALAACPAFSDNQLLSASQLNCISSIQSLAGAPLNVYVAPSGIDSNTCLAANSPCASINVAINKGITNTIAAGQSVAVNIASGTYGESIFVNFPLTGAANTTPVPDGVHVEPGQIILQGAGSTVTTLGGGTSCGTIIVSNYGSVAIRGLKLTAIAASCQSTVFVQMAGTVNIHDDVDFGAASVDQIHIENEGSQVQVWNSYKISGGATRHINASNGLYIHSAFPSGVITFTGTPTFSDAWAVASEGGNVQFNSGVSFAGSFTGKRFHASRNAVIRSDVSSLYTWIPGTIAGTVDTGGGYYGPVLGDQTVAATPATNGHVYLLPDGAGFTQIGVSSGLSAFSGGSSVAGIFPYQVSNGNAYIDALNIDPAGTTLHLRTYASGGNYNDVTVDNGGRLLVNASPTVASALSGASNAAGIFTYMTTAGVGYFDVLTGGSGSTSAHIRMYTGSGVYADTSIDSSGGWLFPGRLTAHGITGTTAGAGKKAVCVDGTTGELFQSATASC